MSFMYDFQTTDVPETGIDAKSVCETCQCAAEPWVCLTCYKAHCGRYVHEHALMHHLAEPSHSMALSLADLTVWCYPCEAYVHNEKLIPAKSSAHISKFGEAMPH
ncbi:Zn-finger in ubiquitin-hydrolase and other protein [Ancylostoma ceylanicum]|uniref:Zn-finger in ubiquitin-hydrolase and other protein n=3 Tax=Ancylostoma ceylanicum TaxID=53326 RepID=A0A0D6MC93_9BILA|nr:Zn-finger in ubiquitin-hydrolase and other protein [Ancylostoma ceylanicum]EYC09484.1 hypothetical protein Y032_0060g3142 [Ancylostoma ceylanicum]